MRKDVKKPEETRWDQEILNSHPILFCQKDKPITASCMAIGLEFGEGWKESVTKLADQLEALNLTYWPKWRVRIQADQIKEKFGTLRFYYTVRADPTGLLGWRLRKWTALYEKLCRIDYGRKEVEDSPTSSYDEKRELTFEDYVRGIKNPHKCTNVDYVEEDGKYYEIAHMTRFRKIHHEPTKNRILWKLRNFAMRRLGAIASEFEPTAEQRVILGMLNAKARALVEIAERECHDICEMCGRQIGTEWSPCCTTRDYIQYVCRDCAKKRGSYYENSDLYVDGKLHMTKAQLEKKRRADIAKLVKEHKKYEAEVEKALKAKNVKSSKGVKPKKTNKKANT